MGVTKLLGHLVTRSCKIGQSPLKASVKALTLLRSFKVSKLVLAFYKVNEVDNIHEFLTMLRNVLLKEIMGLYDFDTDLLTLIYMIPKNNAHFTAAGKNR